LAYEPLISELNQNLKLIGLQPFPIPMGFRLPQDYTQTEAPVVLENFDGFPDPTDSKADGQVMALRPALKFKNVELVTHAYVARLDTDATGNHVTKVFAYVGGEEIVINADIVIVACGAVNSAALLLRSKNEKHPGGLANNSGFVGRNLMLHHNGCLVAFTKEMINDSVFQKSLVLADFYHGADDSEWPLGEIQLMGRNDPDTILWLAKNIYPGKSYAELRNMTIDFWLTAEDLASPENRVEITPEGRIKVHYQRTNYAAYEKLKDKLKQVFVKLGELDEKFQGIQWAGYDLDISGMSHQNGTCRFGSDPRTSVLDLHCKAHDVQNLYVVDASFFPSCGAFNPSLTIAANALRVGDYILNEVLKIKSIEKRTEAPA
jgi:choline dehydrogenase-like flavoprotein